jgi:hypothetical protein
MENLNNISVVIFTIINILILLTSITYYRKAKKHIQNASYEKIVIKETTKNPLVIKDQFIYSIYHQSIMGDIYHNRIMKESSYRMMDYIAKQNVIEVEEEPIDQLSKKITLKLTVLK